DVSVLYRIKGIVATDIGVTWAAQETDAVVTAAVPHPLQFNRPRTVSGFAIGLRHEETAVHFNIAAIVPPRGPIQVAVFAGPSVIRVKQGIVTGVTVNETYPYDTATFASASGIEIARARLGYNAGIDVAVRLWKSFGLGATARYSRADVRFTPMDG